MVFLSTTITLRYPKTNNQLRTSSNLRNQATIQDGRVIVLNVQGRQTQSYTGNFAKSKATGIRVSKNTGNATANKSRIIRYDIDAFDSDCDEIPTASAVFMAHLCAYDSDVLSKQDAMIMYVIEEMSNQVAKCNAVNQENKTVNESLTAELERYKEQV
ncbi:hypothetical protein Tco_1235884 [Tanacetum coccineum]